jgi:hypothetical protein
MLRRAYPLVAFVAILVVFVGFERAFSPPFQSCIKQHPQNESGTPAEENPSGFCITVDAYGRCTGSFIDANGNGITALATVVIAAFTVTLWIATSRQGVLNREALIADKRAFVSADGFKQEWVHDIATDTYSRRFRPHWKNTGSTPTKRLTTHVECEIRNTPLPDGYVFTATNAHIGRGVIPPQSDVYGGAAPLAAIQPQDLVAAQNLQRFIYLWGWTKYFDVFPNTPEHITHFCWYITVGGDPMTFVPNTPGQTPTPGVLIFSYLHAR